MGKLVLYANLWSLSGHPGREREWSLDRKLKAVKAAGFSAVSGPSQKGLTDLASGHGLRRLTAFIARDAEVLLKNLDLCAEEKPERVNIQIGTPQHSRKEAGRLLGRARKWAAERKLRISFETHRGTVLETPDKLKSLAEDYKKAAGDLLPVTWDFSHHAVVRQIPCGSWAQVLLEDPSLIQSADLFHLRPYTAHHVQVPVTWRGKQTPETTAWLPFAREILRLWRSAPGNRKRELFVCPELGPRGEYALWSFPPSWPQTIMLGEFLRKEWREGSVNRKTAKGREE